MNADLVRIVDSIARDKNIDKELVFSDLEQAMISAVRKAHDPADETTAEKHSISGPWRQRGPDVASAPGPRRSSRLQSPSA